MPRFAFGAVATRAQSAIRELPAMKSSHTP
jgi:hypothetical protein